MRLIKDIRLYKNKNEKINFETKYLNAMVKRIVMKLRENKFCLSDEYDHLYINYTYSLNKDEIKMRPRESFKEFRWFRYIDIGVNKEEYADLNDKRYLELLKKALIKYFAKDDEYYNIINNSFMTALNEGENMLMKFKEKKSAKKTAIIYLRCLDNCNFLPLLRVYDEKNGVILEKDLPETLELAYIGTILLNDIRVEIKPRDNFFAKDLKSIIYKF